MEAICLPSYDWIQYQEVLPKLRSYTRVSFTQQGATTLQPGPLSTHPAIVSTFAATNFVQGPLIFQKST